MIQKKTEPARILSMVSRIRTRIRTKGIVPSACTVFVAPPATPRSTKRTIVAGTFSRDCSNEASAWSSPILLNYRAYPGSILS